MNVWYRVLEQCEESMYGPVESSMDSFADADELAWAAKQCAEHYHSRHDGWEASWPMTFALHESEDGPVVVCHEVDREMMPIFVTLGNGTPCKAKW